MTTEKTTANLFRDDPCPKRRLETVDNLDALGEQVPPMPYAPEKRLATLELWLSYAFPGDPVAHVIPPGRNSATRSTRRR